MRGVKHYLGGAMSCAALLAVSLGAHAERAPVLQQIDLPHPYYYREMYLPQLTSGPGSLCWLPDSQTLIYSMAGSLWQQRLGTPEAQQLTAGRSYDYQPDASADGKYVVYSSYRADAIDLWVLDRSTGTTHPLLQNGAVNVEPRFSPDARRIAFVSTATHGHFHIFVADFDQGRLGAVEQLTPEHASELPRYYYSAIDHEISPVWTRDGAELLYISNRGHIYGTGGLWRMPAHAGSEPHEIHYEETNWRARPDFSPEGNRLVYGSYAGRQWHNLWILPAGGGDPLPLAFGDYDQVNPRWSPDGGHIAFIANRDGNTELDVMTLPGGAFSRLPVTTRRYMGPTGTVHLMLRQGGDAGVARISVTDANGMFHAPQDVWINADDGFDRRERAFEAHYFHLLGAADVTVPAGRAHVEIMHGFTRSLEAHDIEIAAGETRELLVDLDERPLTVPQEGHWVSGDLHVHMNYGGDYRNTPAHLVTQARGESLNVVESLIVNKEQRFPDIAWNGQQLDAASRNDTLVVHGQEFHTSYWGHLGLLGLSGGIILPGYAGYPRTAASSLFPSNSDVAKLAHERSALVGYVHPFDTPPHPFDEHERLTNALPVDAALGNVDYIEALGFSDHRATSDVWYRLLNLGFRLPAGAGTDAMANFASLRGPVGMNRVYARIEGELTPGSFLQAIKQGRTFATNGPLLGFTLAGVAPGEELRFGTPQASLAFSAHLKSLVPVDQLELVCNGHVVRSFLSTHAAASGDFHGTVPLRQSGWCLLRAQTHGARYPVLDNYVFATTSPVYVTIAGQRPRSSADAEYFLAWIERMRTTTNAYPDWNDASEKTHVLQQLDAARGVFTSLR